MVEYVSLTKLRDISKTSSATARSRLADAGITPNAEGRFPLDAALAAIDLQRSPDKALGRQAASPGAIAPTANSSPATGRGNAPSDLATARAESERQRARKLRLENERIEGDLLSKAAVIDAGIHFAAHMRAGLLSFGAAVAPTLAGLSADKIAATINEAMRGLLGRLGDAQDFIFDRELA